MEKLLGGEPTHHKHMLYGRDSDSLKLTFCTEISFTAHISSLPKD